MSEPVPIVLSCRDLQKTFRQGDYSVPVLAGVDIEVRRGETVAIVGASGSGKSTLLHLLGGLDAASAGEIVVMGRRLDQLGEREKGNLRNRGLGFVYQFHHLLPEFTALENVVMPLLIRRMAADEATRRAAAVLKRVGVSAPVSHNPGEISRGGGPRAPFGRGPGAGPAGR